MSIGNSAYGFGRYTARIARSDEATDHLERAITRFGKLGMTADVGRTRLDLASVEQGVEQGACLMRAGARRGKLAAQSSYQREAAMPKTSKSSATTVHAAPGYDGHFEDLGGYTVAFETYSDDADLAPLFASLPDDRCQCPHWGVVLKGAVTYRYADREETIEAGEAYFARPGHTPMLHAGTEVIEFSPTAEMERTLEVVLRNIEAAEATS